MQDGNTEIAPQFWGPSFDTTVLTDACELLRYRCSLQKSNSWVQRMTQQQEMMRKIKLGCIFPRPAAMILKVWSPKSSLSTTWKLVKITDFLDLIPDYWVTSAPPPAPVIHFRFVIPMVCLGAGKVVESCWGGMVG